MKVTQNPLNFACFEEDMPSLGKGCFGETEADQTFGQGDDEWEGLDSEE